MRSPSLAQTGAPGRPKLPAELIQGTAGLLAVRVTHAALTTALAVLLARLLGPEGYGIYAHGLALLTLLAVLARLGLPNLLVREMAAALAGQRWSHIRALLRLAGIVVALTSGLLMMAVAATLWWLAPGSTVYMATLAVGLPLLPVLALGDTRGAALRGLGHVIEGQLPDHVLRPGLLFLAIGAIVLAGATVTPVSAMATHAVVAALALGAGAWRLHCRLPGEVRAARPSGPVHAWGRSVVPLAFVAGMQVLIMQTDVLMLGVLATSADVGVYRVAVQASLLVAFGLEAAKIASAPRLASLHARGEPAEQARSFQAAVMVALTLGGVTAAGLVLAGPWLIERVFGAAYGGAYLPLVILCGGQLARALGAMAGELLNMSRREGLTARAVAVAAVANVALNAALIPAFGTAGAATATAVSFLLWSAIAALGAHSHLRHGRTE